MEQKVIITDSQYIVNSLIEEGWLVKSITPQYVTTGGNSHFMVNFVFY